MTNILFVYETEMPTVSIERDYWMNLSSEYGITSKFVRLVDVKRVELKWCDILMLIRPNNSLSWRIAQAVKRTGRFVITICDDDLLHLPKTIPDLPWKKQGLIKALNYSSVIMSKNRYLLNQMIKFTAEKRGVYVDTVVRQQEILERDYDEETDDVVKIVYAAGGGQHESLFEEIVLPALKKVASRVPNSFSITFVSVHPNCSELEKDVHIKYVKGMPLLEYRKFMEESKFDIGVAPLVSNDFTKCKHFNKYLEYSLSGILGIYSNVEPYTYVVQDGLNGLLAENTHTSWEEKLVLAIGDSEYRATMARKAQEHVCETFDEKEILQRLFSDIPELQRDGHIEYDDCGGFCRCRWLTYYRFLRGIEYIYKLFFYLKSEGLRSVIRRSAERIKMLIFT